MARLGELLRAQREKKGITLDQAAADTRIREKFLTALDLVHIFAGEAA